MNFNVTHGIGLLAVHRSFTLYSTIIITYVAYVIITLMTINIIDTFVRPDNIINRFDQSLEVFSFFNFVIKLYLLQQ